MPFAMQSSPAVGPRRLAEGAAVLVTALQSGHVSFVYGTVLQMGSSHRQQIQRNFIVACL